VILIFEYVIREDWLCPMTWGGHQGDAAKNATALIHRGL